MVLELLNKNNILQVLIYSSRFTGPTKISVPFLSSPNIFLPDNQIVFSKQFENLKIEHKTCPILVWVYFPLKGIVSDCNNIFLWHESEDINKKSLFPKFHLIPILRFQVMHDYVSSITPIDYCVKQSLMYETFCENCSHFILK